METGDGDAKVTAGTEGGKHNTDDWCRGQHYSETKTRADTILPDSVHCLHGIHNIKQ